MKRIVMFIISILIFVFLFGCSDKDCVVISYEVNGGFILNDQYLFNDERNKFILLETKKEGHKLIGWYTDPYFTPSSRVTNDSVFNENTTLYAKWELETYIVSIQYDDAEKKYFVKYGETFTFEKLTYKDRYYQFFYKNNNKLPDTIIVTGDIYVIGSTEEWS